MYLRDRADSEGKCWPGIKTIASDMRLSRSTVKRALTDLEQHGYLQKIPRYCLPRFDPEQETEFLKYAKHYVLDGLLFCRMMVEAGSFASLAEYRHVRQIGAIYNNSAKTAQKSFPSLPSKADTRMKAYLRMNC